MQTIFDLISHNKLTLKTDEAAELLGISKPTLYELIHSEKANFPSVRVGTQGRGFIIPTLSLLKWLDTQSGGDGDLSFLAKTYQSVQSNSHIGNTGGKYE
jgi:excisionase family DNA binding protein